MGSCYGLDSEIPEQDGEACLGFFAWSAEEPGDGLLDQPGYLLAQCFCVQPAIKQSVNSRCQA
jgi:hypothetical protein